MRKVEEWIGKDDNAAIPLRVKTRVFLAHDGRCHRSGRKIMPGDPWECDHVIALINGGENRERNLAPILAEKHREKTAEDVKLKSKIARQRAKHIGAWPKSKRPLKSRGFEPSRVAHDATRKVST
jgi:5-methylcytosine-specific restriction protein A